jgi:hypothetical protein
LTTFSEDCNKKVFDDQHKSVQFTAKQSDLRARRLSSAPARKPPLSTSLSPRAWHPWPTASSPPLRRLEQPSRGPRRPLRQLIRLDRDCKRRHRPDHRCLTRLGKFNDTRDRETEPCFVATLHQIKREEVRRKHKVREHDRHHALDHRPRRRKPDPGRPPGDLEPVAAGDHPDEPAEDRPLDGWYTHGGVASMTLCLCHPAVISSRC